MQFRRISENPSCAAFITAVLWFAVMESMTPRWGSKREVFHLPGSAAVSDERILSRSDHSESVRSGGGRKPDQRSRTSCRISSVITPLLFDGIRFGVRFGFFQEVFPCLSDYCGGVVVCQLFRRFPASFRKNLPTSLGIR